MTNDDILAAILAQVTPVQPRVSRLEEAEGCVLAEAVLGTVDVPGAPTATRDGYAVRTADLAGQSRGTRCRTEVSGISIPGAAVPELRASCACRVLTGARLPEGADALVPEEKVILLDGPGGAATIEFELGEVATGRHIAGVGCEFARGRQALPAHCVLGPLELSVLSALEFDAIRVVPKPSVAIVVTGSELYARSAAGSARSLLASNAVLAAAMVRASGGVVASTEVVRDDGVELSAAFTRALEADLILSTGGTGRGPTDLLRRALREREAASLWDVDSGGLRPVPFRILHGTRPGARTPHLALPGRPIAAMVAFMLFGRPLLSHLAGLPLRRPDYRTAILDDPQGAAMTQRFVPVRLEHRDAGLVATPTADAALYGLSAGVGEHGFALMPRPGDAPCGGTVRVLLAPWLASDPGSGRPDGAVQARAAAACVAACA